MVSTSIGYHRKKPPTQVARAKEIILNQVSSSPHARSHDLLISLFRIRPLRGSNGMDGSSRPRFHESVSRHPLASHSVSTNSAHTRRMCRGKTACVAGKVRLVHWALVRPLAGRRSWPRGRRTASSDALSQTTPLSQRAMAPAPAIWRGECVRRPASPTALRRALRARSCTCWRGGRFTRLAPIHFLFFVRPKSRSPSPEYPLPHTSTMRPPALWLACLLCAL